MAASLDLGQRRVVGIIAGDGNLDVVLGFELLDQFRVCVVTPVIQVQLTGGIGRAGGPGGHCYREADSGCG